MIYAHVVINHLVYYINSMLIPKLVLYIYVEENKIRYFLNYI